MVTILLVSVAGALLSELVLYTSKKVEREEIRRKWDEKNMKSFCKTHSEQIKSRIWGC